MSDHQADAPTPVDARALASDPEDRSQLLERRMHLGWAAESTTHLPIPAAFKTSIPAVAAILYWSGVVFGLVFAAPKANDGDLAVVATLSIVLFHATWRTARPLKLNHPDRAHQMFPITDAALIGVALGLSGGFQSPFALCLLAAVAVGAFGWGITKGVICLAVATAAMAVPVLFGAGGIGLNSLSELNVLVAVAIFGAVVSWARARLIEVEARRAHLAGRMESLSETNDLLHILNHVARTLPTSLDLREALTAARDQITTSIEATVIALLVLDETGEHWTPQLSEGCALAPSSSYEELPRPFRQVIEAGHSLLEPELTTGLAPESRTGVYTLLKTRGTTVGVLAVEHSEPDAYSERHLRIVDGLADVLALTVDNARWFRRLRSLGATEERSRIARDLHDRLGQWLTYISFEIERIMGESSSPNPQMSELYGNVQNAIDELRETLRQLRAEVTAARPFSVVAKEHSERFSNRGKSRVNFRSSDPDESLSVPVENELLRILQEALNNVERHANASTVDVLWNVGEDEALLQISDDGEGFDLGYSVRESAFGLVGIRERADSIGASLDLCSTPGQGTKIVVSVPRLKPEVLT